MFFKKLQKEILLLNLFNFVLLIILYFSFHEKFNFVPELSSYAETFNGLSELKNLLIPFSIIYYFCFSTMIIVSLNKLNGRLVTTKDYKFYYFSSILYFLLYLIVFLSMIFICKRIISFNLEHAVTDSPLVFWTMFTVIVGVIILKMITYAKVQTRVQYFKTKDGVKLISYFSGFKTLLKIKHILVFVVLALLFAGIPFLLLLYSVFKNSYLLSIISLIVTILFFATGKLFIYYVFFGLNNKLVPKKEEKTVDKADDKIEKNSSNKEIKKTAKPRKRIRKQTKKEEALKIEENNKDESSQSE